MSLLLKKHGGLPGYVPGGHDEAPGSIRLNTNESPYPPSPGVAAAVANVIGDLQIYNDPDCTKLREALAGVYGVTPENIMCANGSDEVLYMAFIAYADSENPIMLPDVTYGYYELFAALHGIPLVKKPLAEDWTIDPADYENAGCMVVMPNPNAPTGLPLSVSDIRKICKVNEGHVVLIDEAYIDFGAETCLPLIDECENLIIVRTYSKSRSMAGARIGFALACKERIDELNAIHNAFGLYSVSKMAQAAGVAACEENEYYMENCRKIMEARGFAIDALREIGMTVTDSVGNFVFASVPGIDDSTEIAKALEARHILVRRWNSPRVRAWLRISIGTMEQMRALVSALREILQK